jgi:hypothetical protein
MSTLTETLRSNLDNPVSSPEFDLYTALDKVLYGVGLSPADSGGKITFYGRDPIVPSPLRFGAMSAIGLAAKAVAASAIWRFRSGEGQDIHVDVRKALRRFAPFFEREWERINGHKASFASDPENPFIQYPSMTLWHKTRDGRWIMPATSTPDCELVQLPCLDVTIVLVLFRMRSCNGALMNLRRPLRKRVYRLRCFAQLKNLWKKFNI